MVVSIYLTLPFVREDGHLRMVVCFYVHVGICAAFKADIGIVKAIHFHSCPFFHPNGAIRVTHKEYSRVRIKLYILCMVEEQVTTCQLVQVRVQVEILPDYWMELALASYELKDYEQTLEYIDKFEKIYYPVIYHDSDYAYLLMVKSDCISQLYGKDKYDELENICEKILNNIESNDWEVKFYVLSLYMEIYRNSSNHQIAEKAYELFPAVLSELIDDYKEDTTSYLAGEYSKQGLSQIQIDIDSAEVEVTSAANNIAKHEEIQIKNGKKEKVYRKEAAYIILQDKLAKAEEKLNNLIDNYSEFERTSKLMVPPSSDFVCSLMKEYIELTKMLGYTDSVIFRSICTSFFESVSQNSTVWNEFKEYNFDLLPEPRTEVRYRHEVHDKFLFWGGVTSAIFEIPLSLINSTAANSESIISTENLTAFIVIDNLFQFPLIVGVDATEVGLEAIVNKEMYGTVRNDYETQVEIIDTLIDYLLNENDMSSFPYLTDSKNFYRTDGIKITQENYEEFI